MSRHPLSAVCCACLPVNGWPVLSTVGQDNGVRLFKMVAKRMRVSLPWITFPAFSPKFVRSVFPNRASGIARRSDDNQEGQGRSCHPLPIGFV